MRVKGKDKKNFVEKNLFYFSISLDTIYNITLQSGAANAKECFSSKDDDLHADLHLSSIRCYEIARILLSLATSSTRFFV